MPSHSRRAKSSGLANRPLPRIQPWDFEKRMRRVDGVVAIYGMTGSGKTNGTRAILDATGNRFYDIMLFSASNKYTGDFDGIPPNKMFHTFDTGLEPHRDRIANFVRCAFNHRKKLKGLDKLKRDREEGRISKEEYEERYEEITYGHVYCIILDDVLFGKNDLGDEIFTKIARMGRHANLVVFILAQKVTSIVTDVRQQARLSLAFNVKAGKEILHDEVFSTFPTFSDFLETYSAQSKNHSCLVNDEVNSYNPKTNEIVYYTWKPPDPSNIRRRRYGGHHLWATAQEMLDEEKTEEYELENEVAEDLRAQQSRLLYMHSDKEYKNSLNASMFTNHMQNFYKQQQEQETPVYEEDEEAT